MIHDNDSPVAFKEAVALRNRAAQHRRMTSPQEAEAAILELCEARGPAHSICPSEAARRLASGDEWRRHLGLVRAAAASLARAGRIDILRKGKPVAPEAMRGVIRLRQKPPG